VYDATILLSVCGQLTLQLPVCVYVYVSLFIITSVCPSLCIYVYVSLFIITSVCTALSNCPSLSSYLYVPTSELLNQFVNFCVS
jgi:hypothetical protein